MKLALALALALSAFACTSADPSPMSEARRQELEADVADFLDTYRRTLGEGDAAAMRELFVQDGRFSHLEDGSKRYPSPEDIVRALSELPAGSSITTEYSDNEILVLTDSLAYVSANFRSEMVFPGVPPFTVTGVHSSLVEFTDGRWRMLRGHNSSVRETGDW